MTTQVQSASQRILLCIQKPSTYQSSIIFSENKYLNRRSNWSMFLLRNKLLIFSPNHCPGTLLSTSGKSWGLLMHHLIVEPLLIGDTGSGGAHNALLALWRMVRRRSWKLLQYVSISFMVDYGSSLQIWFIFRRSMILGGAYPLPLMSKRENEAEDYEVAIKSKGGDCWHYGSWFRCCP